MFFGDCNTLYRYRVSYWLDDAHQHCRTSSWLGHIIKMCQRAPARAGTRIKEQKMSDYTPQIDVEDVSQNEEARRNRRLDCSQTVILLLIVVVIGLLALWAAGIFDPLGGSEECECPTTEATPATTAETTTTATATATPAPATATPAETADPDRCEAIVMNPIGSGNYFWLNGGTAVVSVFAGDETETVFVISATNSGAIDLREGVNGSAWLYGSNCPVEEVVLDARQHASRIGALPPTGTGTGSAISSADIYKYFDNTQVQ